MLSFPFLSIHLYPFLSIYLYIYIYTHTHFWRKVYVRQYVLLSCGRVLLSFIWRSGGHLFVYFRGSIPRVLTYIYITSICVAAPGLCPALVLREKQVVLLRVCILSRQNGKLSKCQFRKVVYCSETLSFTHSHSHTHTHTHTHQGQ